MTRLVTVYRWSEKIKPSVQIVDAHGIFIKYGSDCIESNKTWGTFTTAIVEMLDGTVRSVDVNMISFTKPSSVNYILLYVIYLSRGQNFLTAVKNERSAAVVCPECKCGDFTHLSDCKIYLK